jgi:hypothetical protein
VNHFQRAAAQGAALGLFFALNAALAEGEPRFSMPARGDVLASGVVHEVRWTSACEDESEADEMELVLSVDGGWTFPIRLTADLSPCSSSFRWKVPSFSTSRAVLAVRRGIEGEPESERVAIVSGEFRITSFETSPTSSLVRGPSEWWTEQALLEIGAENLLGDAMRGPSEHVGVPSVDSDLDEPPSELRAATLDSTGQRVLSGDLVEANAARPPASRRAPFLPLRE